MAWSNRSRTREAPTPTNISTNSLPLIEKKGTPASPAMAFASKVLPVPGGPTSKIPRGIRAPSAVKRSRDFKKSTTSLSSCLASSTPATSLKVTCGLSPGNKRALLRPKLIAWLLAPRARMNITIINTINIRPIPYSIIILNQSILGATKVTCTGGLRFKPVT